MGKKLLRGSLKPRTEGTKDNPLTDYEKQIIQKKKEAKQKTEQATFGVLAGKFGDKSSTLSDIANSLGVTLKSLKKENPQIEDLNKIRKNQRINIPVRRQTFFEKYIAGTKTKPSTRKVETSRGAEELAVKKGAEGRVYEGMSKAEMKAISNRRGGGAVMKSRGGTFKGTF
tara:strand:+ start:114 stop:626 length:513 start_codon:yes stop_codon:yes gene_type:complete